VRWAGGGYLKRPVEGTWTLHLEMQSHEPANAVYLNGHLLGYLPVKDYVYSWYTAILDVPSVWLQPGYNEITILAGTLPPQLQRPGFVWDEVLFRSIRLEPPTALVWGQ
jgi:hypothetical protein